MPRLVVFEGARVLMDEHVVPDHLDDEHCSVQLLERLAWAIEDAEGPPGGVEQVTDYREVYGA